MGFLDNKDKVKFFEALNSEKKAITYSEVRLDTDYSEVMPAEVSTESLFSRNVPLKVPIASAAMDTVTEAKMAIAMARAGGIGVIHKNFTPEEQAHQVTAVKYYLNAMIDNPRTAAPHETVESLLNKVEEKNWSFRTFPVLSGEGKLIGIVTQNDFDFCIDQTARIEQIMSTDLVIAPANTTIEQAYQIMHERKKKVLPLVSERGELAGLYIWSDVRRATQGDSKTFNTDERGQLRVAAAIGVYDDAFSRLELLTKRNVDVVVIDTAHGDTKSVLETLREVKRLYSVDVVVGNISGRTSGKRLVEAGADGIKVGQGPGSICTTRIVAGVGCPQITAIYNAVRYAEPAGIPVCADGGLQHSGDLPIALAAGACSVMMGSMLAGTDEAPGETFFADGQYWKGYRGMGSLGAMESRAGSRDRYRQAGMKKLVPEGVEGRVQYKGPVTDALDRYVGGLRSGMGYIGARTIEDVRERGDFILIGQGGISESHPHDIVITREPPNYRGI